MKKPNAWGLYDMAGNALEWTNDNYYKYTVASQIDPVGPTVSEVDSAFYKYQPSNPDKQYASAIGHVSRGGDIYNPAINQSSTYRGGTWGLPKTAGFRMVRRP